MTTYAYNGAEKITVKEFFKRLRAAREIVRKGKTYCQERPTFCHHCALKAAGIYTYGGPHQGWSFNHTREEVLAMFDKSLRLLDKFPVTGKEDSK